LLVLASIASSAFPADAPGHRNYTRGTDFHDLADALFILAKRSRICRTSEHFSRMSPQAWSDCRAEPAAAGTGATAVGADGDAAVANVASVERKGGPDEASMSLKRRAIKTGGGHRFALLLRVSDGMNGHAKEFDMAWNYRNTSRYWPLRIRLL